MGVSLKEVSDYLVDRCKNLKGIREDKELNCLFFETNYGFTFKLILKEKDDEKANDLEFDPAASGPDL